MKSGASEFTPDFVVWKPAHDAPGRHHLLEIEVKYRRKIAEFLQRDGLELLSKVKGGWPNLHLILLTDHPDVGRSYFQAISIRDYQAGSELHTGDLHEFSALGIQQSLITRHESLVQQLFGALMERIPPKRARSGHETLAVERLRA